MRALLLLASVPLALAACGDGGTARGPETVQSAQSAPSGPAGYQPDAQYMNPEAGAGSSEGGRGSATTGATQQGTNGLAGGDATANSKQTDPGASP